MSATVRPIRLLGAHALAAIEAIAIGALEPWAAGWLLPHARPLLLSLQRADEGGSAGDASHAGFERHDGEHGRLWIRCKPADRLALLRASLGEVFVSATGRSVDAWASAVADQGWRARNEALCAALVGRAEPTPVDRPDATVYTLGSGAVRLEAEAIGLFAIADAGVLRHVPPRLAGQSEARAPRVALERAAGRAAVRLFVSAGRVELGLRTLLELRPGDVLRLPTRLEDTLTLRHGAAPPLRCALGESAGRAAVRLCLPEREPT